MCSCCSRFEDVPSGPAALVLSKTLEINIASPFWPSSPLPSTNLPNPTSSFAAMGRKLLSDQEEVSKKSKKEKKNKKDKKQKLAAEAQEAAATEELAKSSKKRAKDESGEGGEVENGGEKSTKKRAKDESGEGGEMENGGEKSVAVTGKGFADAKYAPLKSFAAAALPPQVLDCCKGFARPSPIQAHAWPFLLDGRDFIGIAATGSGIVKFGDFCYHLVSSAAFCSNC